MAVTKTHPIKSTLKAAIDYICNPEKTDGKLLVSSYGCAAETADIEFAWTRRHAIDKGTNLGRHLIQAFQPGEVTPEQAHEIGMELAKEILGGKYEFVLTTHIDKDHVHNHLIFNTVSFADHKHYHSNKRSYHYIRRTSDRLCKEHGLSVIIPGKDKGKSYIEHQAAQNGTSYKAKLKAAIDRLLPACSDLEELLRRLQREGYEIKRGKYISAKAPDQERFTRLKTLGVDYTEEALADRIAGGSRPSRQPKQQNGKISLLIDITGIDNGIHIGAVHQSAEIFKGVLFAGCQHIAEQLRQNGKIVIAPFLETLVIAARIHRGYQVPHTPGHKKAVALIKAIGLG